MLQAVVRFVGGFNHVVGKLPLHAYEFADHRLHSPSIQARPDFQLDLIPSGSFDPIVGRPETWVPARTTLGCISEMQQPFNKALLRPTNRRRRADSAR